VTEHQTTTDQTTTEQTTTIVIFGASGDLTRRKLVPALASLYCKGRLGPDVQIVGMARSQMTDQEFRDALDKGLDDSDQFHPGDAEWQEFSQRIHYCCGDVSSAKDLGALSQTLAGVENPGKPANRLYYLALAPFLYEPAILNLGQAGFGVEDGCWRRVVVEKPFGTDLTSAKALNRVAHSVFNEHQMYRIDHYLGKETVQNLLVFRFANTIFEPIWSRNYIDNVQITVSDRAAYYDEAGVLRDMFQNHLLQLLTVVAMEPPSTFEAATLRNEKVKVLESVRRMTPDEAVANSVYAQYDGYLSEKRGPQDSRTPSYVALRLAIDN
jgi:glucose-6-phosphate 1-dehydrogenase